MLYRGDKLYWVRWSFGSPFGGWVCDDGPSHSRGPFALDRATQILHEIADHQRCQVRYAADGRSATFHNLSGSQTGSIYLA